MSAIYQGEFLELTAQDLQTLSQELNPNDDTQQLVIINEDEEWMNKLLDEWDSVPISPSLFFREVNRIEKEKQGYTEDQIEEMWEESYRLESDLLETENEW